MLAGAGLPHAVLDGGADSQLTVVPVTMAKGLEFDQVIVVEPARIAGRGIAWPAPAVRRADPGRVAADRAARRARCPGRWAAELGGPVGGPLVRSP